MWKKCDFLLQHLKFLDNVPSEGTVIGKCKKWSSFISGSVKTTLQYWKDNSEILCGTFKFSQKNSYNTTSAPVEGLFSISAD